VRPIGLGRKAVQDTLAGMSDQPTKLDYYEKLVQLNKLIAEVRQFHTDVANLANSSVGRRRAEDLEPQLTAIRTLIAGTIVLAVETSPGSS
jgi:hypothetical protein